MRTINTFNLCKTQIFVYAHVQFLMISSITGKQDELEAMERSTDVFLVLVMVNHKIVLEVFFACNRNESRLSIAFLTILMMLIDFLQGTLSDLIFPV
ncbi:hypothetical protein C5167_042412 [Papaver somniferum]|uniref:Uncharacterized protein n=1 Tax=Papaver somniferum TaxID=3469 RepID=A0A4Y7L3S8_PAPSO|nr:hypothetical protein C5167_042412 [Papaver somniferum]